MMRWLVLALIAANLSYGGWQWQQRAVVRANAAAEAVFPPVEANYSGVPRLLLLSERPAPPPEDVAQPPGRVEAAVGDVPPGGASRGGPPPASSLPGDSSPVQPESCAALGPFSEKVSARQVQGRLTDVDIAAELRARERVVRNDHWVHIPPLPTREAALSLLRELQARHIDSFLIADGDLERGISLGIFTRTESAERIAAQHRQLGYEVAIRKLPRSRTEHWLVLAPEAATAVDPALLERLRKGGLSVEFSSQPCIDVAQSPEFD